MRLAVIDLGTNTWNLIVAEPGPGDSFKILWDEKLPVKIGKGGISKGIILPDAMERGLDALQKHIKTIQQLEAEYVEVVATSAFRTASNGEEFAKIIRVKTGLRVNIISGNLEADLIYKGITASVRLDEDPVLILDIGGGSNELIIGNRDQIFWKKSYALGIARLLEKFKLSDPISPMELEQVRSYLAHEMKDFSEVRPAYNINTLIGAAGSFETFASMLHFLFPKRYLHSVDVITQKISLEDFDYLYHLLVTSTPEERLKMKGLEVMRVEMIVLAAVFVQFILKTFKLNQLIQSNFSLKEGLVAELVAGGKERTSMNENRKN
jgi:exopolyphosphatase / guanosine-5'-triphosphate,3'-diphosphate pyrophosphatase